LEAAAAGAEDPLSPSPKMLISSWAFSANQTNIKMKY